jgi:hypothetical protein
VTSYIPGQLTISLDQLTSSISGQLSSSSDQLTKIVHQISWADQNFTRLATSQLTKSPDQLTSYQVSLSVHQIS